MEKRKYLLGLARKFCYGIVMLMITYIVVYFIGGKDVFEVEIDKLKDIKVFVNLFVLSGFYWCGIFAIVENVIKMPILEKSPIKVSCLFILLMIVMIILSSFMDNYSENIVAIKLVLAVIVVFLQGIIVMIINSIDVYKLNKKIKEKNKN